MVVVVSREKRTKALIKAYVVKSLAETNDLLKIRAKSFVFILTRRVTIPPSVLNPERVLMPRALKPRRPKHKRLPFRCVELR